VLRAAALLTVVPLAVSALAGCAAAPPPTATPPAPSTVVAATPPPALPSFAHIVIVVEENRSYADIIGNPKAPYLNSLAAQGVSFTNSYAETHPSQPNYLALFSGSIQGVRSDACPHTFSAPSLGGELLAAGRTFVGYSEDLPAVGFTGCTEGKYARKHNPWVNFTDVPASANQPLTALPSDWADLPDLSFVIPNLDHDMHDGSIAQGDSWLRDHLDGYAQWAASHDSLLMVTWDEDDYSAANQIPTILVGANLRSGQYDERIDHFRVLRTIDDLFGLPYAGAAATATPITDIWVG